MKRLYKSRNQVVIDGVCGGMAEYLNMDVTIVRLIFVALLFFTGSGLLIYIVCAIVIPRAPLIDEHYVDDPQRRPLE